MTDNEYASIIYCRAYCVDSDGGNTNTRGILEAISTLSMREQAALESYYRNGNTFEQTGKIIGGVKREAARRVVQKAILKLRHPSRLCKFSIKAQID